MEEELESAANEYACGEYDPAAPWRWKGDLHVQSKESFIAGATWLQEQSGWIKCSERLPDIGERVLVYAPNSHAIFMVAYRNMRGTWKNSNGNYVHDDSDFITHWMPLPDKPQQV